MEVVCLLSSQMLAVGRRPVFYIAGEFSNSISLKRTVVELEKR